MKETIKDKLKKNVKKKRSGMNNNNNRRNNGEEAVTETHCISCGGSVQDPESPVPLHIRQPRRVPEALGKGVAVNLQLGDLEQRAEREHFLHELIHVQSLVD